MSDRRLLLDRIARRGFSVGVIGFSYVGLPLSVRLGEVGFRVVGLDIDPVKVDH